MVFLPEHTSGSLKKKWSDDDVQEICSESQTQTSHFLAVTLKKKKYNKMKTNFKTVFYSSCYVQHGFVSPRGTSQDLSRLLPHKEQEVDEKGRG